MTTLYEFFEQIAPSLHTSAAQLAAYAAEDTIGGYVPGQQDGWIVGSVWEVEGKALYALIRALKPKRLLEIGTRRGCSTTHLLSALEANGVGELVSLDLEPFLGAIPEALQHRWTFVQTDALAWLRQAHGLFDFVFEDAAHSYEFTRDCIALCQKLGAQLTVSHDAMHFGVGADIRRAWDDVLGAGTYQTALIEPSDCGFSWQFAAPVRSRSETPILSIVTGTYQRLGYLMEMVKSVRRQLPDDLGYEFVIVDGGSTDGTLDWLQAQPDCFVIEQGELLGAIRAFDAGCESARGDYVLLLNDDVTVVKGAILKALAHLESRTDCGAVAFGDKRPDGGTKTGKTYEVGTLYGLEPKHNQPVAIYYAQCGLFRRWLGDMCGWWGSHDTEWGEFHTYGGDNRLSAEIWKRGYNVDAVEGCAVEDRIAPDTLRQHNHEQETNIGSAYMRAYGGGVKIASLPKPINPQKERLRVLLATLYDRGFGHYKHGLKDAFAKVSWTLEVDWLASPDQLLTTAKQWQPHVIFTQMNDPALMSNLRALAPSAVIVNWYGDVHFQALTAPRMIQQSKYVDLQLVVNADVLPIYAAQGIEAAYWQVAAEPVSDVLPEMPRHEIVFLANAYSPERKALGIALKEMSANVGLYGSDWNELGSGITLYDFAAGAGLYRACKIAIGDNQYRDKGFVSNRLFEALANGAFLLHQHIPGLQELTGLIDGVHYVSWRDLADLKFKVEYYLADEDSRRQIAAAGEAFVKEHHTFEVRVKELFEQLLPRIVNHESGRYDRVDALADRAFVGEWADGIPR